MRDILGVEGTYKWYLCPSCKSSHGSYPEDRIKLVVSDSTLHQFFAPTGFTQYAYPGDIMHTDYITIPGGCIDELYNAFRYECELLPRSRPLDCVLVMGYNDLVRGHSRHFMLDCFKLFTQAVLEHGKEQHPGVPNTIAIATLMYPPQLAWYFDNGPEPPHYNNQMEKINWLNAKIRELNLSNSSPYYPRFHTYGLRKATRYTYDRYGYEHQHSMKSHRWEHWREPIKTSMLHLKDHRRFKMGTAVNNYFIART